MTQQALQKSMESKISSLETEIDEFKNLQDEVKATQELILVQLQSLMARCNGGPLGESSEATFGENQGQDHMYPNFNHQEFGNNGNQQIQSSFLKLDFPRFSEGDDPLVWIYKAEHYFDFFNIEESKKVKIASFHMEEEALQWFQCAHCLINYTNLEDFMTVMYQEFGPSELKDLAKNLVKLKQLGTLKDYVLNLRRLANRKKDISFALLK